MGARTCNPAVRITTAAVLADVCDITMGQAPKGDTYNSDGIGLPLVAGAGDFGQVFPEPMKFTTAAGVRRSQPGDIILGIRASIGAKVLSDGEYCLGRGVAALRARPGLDPRYLWHWTTHAAPTLARKGRGATFLQVNKGDISEMEIPLPPIEEQRRIAAVLDAADALRAKRREAIAKLHTLTQAIFIDMFGDPEFTVADLADVAEVQGGLQVSSKRSVNPIEVPYLRVANVYRGFLDLGEIKMLHVTQKELNRTRLVPGDLLVVEGHGNPSEIGRVGQWDGSIDPCVHQNHLIRVRCDTGLVEPTYVEVFLNSRKGRRALLRAANTTSGLNTISTGDVRTVALPIPGLIEQRRFVAAAESAVQRRRSLADHQRKLDTLFSSLQQRAFRGEL